MSALPSLREFDGARLLRPAPTQRQADAATREAKDRELSALMRAAQLGDQAAYTRLLREIMPLLQRLLRSRLRFLQAADRDDLMQDVLLSLHRAMTTYDPQREFVPWLMAIARNKMVDRARRCARSIANEVLVDDLAAIGPVERLAPCTESYGDPEALREAVSRLPAGQRTAIELLKIRELSSEEAAGVTGMSSVALRVSVHRAIKTLRVSLKSDTAASHRVEVAGRLGISHTKDIDFSRGGIRQSTSPN
jgi:RNA polymerase sigma-70 factor, ECF subfamily